MKALLQTVWIKNIGTNRGKPRLWFECLKIKAAGLIPGAMFDIANHANGLKLSVSETGKYKVSGKTQRGKEVPVLDLDSEAKLGPLYNEKAVRVIVTDQAIYVLPLASEIAKRERLVRLQRKLATNQPLSIASLTHGVGIMSNAAHEGLSSAGLPVSVVIANEIDENYMGQAMHANPVHTASTVQICAAMQEVIQDNWLMAQIPKCEVVELSLPCSGSSIAGRAKRGLSVPEEHPEIGHLIHAALVLIGRLQPSVVVLENVESYKNSGSASILRNQLRDMGYTVREHVLAAKDWGCLENRVRWGLVATTAGLQPLDDVHVDIDLSGAPKKLSELLEAIPLDAKCWSPLTYLKTKEQRDLSAGKGFQMQVVDGESTSVPVIRRLYAKGGSTDPFVRHPVNPDLLRKFTGLEHSRIKQVNPALVDGMSETGKHEALGQSVAAAPWVSLFRQIGHLLMQLKLHGAALLPNDSAGALRHATSIG